jgi:hypothetical protein
MRSHLLKDLSIRGKQPVLEKLPDFDFYNLREVTSFNWSSEPDTISKFTTACLTLDAAYHNSERDPVFGIRLRCSDLRQLRMPELGTSFFLAEIEVEDLSGDQLEGIKYKLKDMGDSRLEVLCGNIEISISDSGAVPSRTNR